LVALILLIGVLFRFIRLPEAAWDLSVLGSPLEVRVTKTWLLVALVTGLTAFGTRYVLAAHPDAPHRLPRPLYLSWVLPSVLAGMAAYLVEMAPAEGIWAGGLLLAALVIGLAVSAEFGALSTDHPGYARARLSLNVLAYLLAFSLFYVIYRTRARSIVTASGTTLVAFLVALDLLSVADVSVGRVALYAGAVGLLVGEATWALNYWQIGNWAGGLFLLAIFYLLAGLAHQHLLERLSLWVLLEFGLVTAAALAAVLVFAP
jgi:FtsH-binding integral membrane protein